jgi:3-hydroxybutyryl-CoA dehydrogenase
LAAEGGSRITRLGVLGAGTMGAGIAQVAATAGVQVLLHDPLPGAVERAREKIAGFLARRVEKEELSPAERDAALVRIHARVAVQDLADAELVVEAIPEDLEIKRQAFRLLDAAAPPRTLLATNTSSLSVARIASAATKPERVLGMHFFNPVPLMALVEVIPGPMTDGAAVERVEAIARQLGKEPVVAADTPGFIVNRVARPFYLEAMRIVGEGAGRVDEVDEALRRIGFRMGPFELVDAIGLDVNFAVSRSVYEQAFFEPRYRPHPMQRTLVDAGRLGRKSRGGFYDYRPDGGRAGVWSGVVRRPDGPRVDHLSEELIAARVLATIVNEAASAVADGVATPAAVDTAMRLGTNYPSGPLEWGERIGLDHVLHTLDALHAAVPDGRYRAVPLLRQLAERGGSFFGTS